MRKEYSFLLLLFAVHILTACASGKEAQTLSRATLSQIIDYENHINEKIKAEKEYYKKSADAVLMSFEKSKTNTFNEIVERSIQNMSKTARSSPKDLEPIDISNFSDQLLKDVENHNKNVSTLLIEYGNDVQNNLILLDKKKYSLKTITKGLERLQEQPSESVQLKMWFKFAKDLRNEMKKTTIENSKNN